MPVVCLFVGSQVFRVYGDFITSNTGHVYHEHPKSVHRISVYPVYDRK